MAAQERVMAKIQGRKWIQAPIIIWWQRVAAILILPVIILMGYLLLNQTKAVTAFQEITSPFGMSSKVDLPDGSTVWLNSGSKLKYPVAFASGERNVYLSGEAFFKVHSDKTHPFVVATANVKVRATGTQFNVEAYLTDTITAVTLVEGKVDVNLYGDKNEQLKPNQRIVLNSNSKTYNLSETNAQHWGVWKDGILAFRDEPLEDVFKRIGRTYNVDIKVKDPVIARQLYRATFEGESLEEILRLLKLSSPIQYKRIDREKQSNNDFKKERIEVYSTK
jgi:ferric-dicitrate binding protein FerR (iron transport regulator)